MHVELLVAPKLSENVPIGHGVQSELPASDHRPGGQSKQSTIDDAPGVLLNVPSGQGLTTVEYCALHDPRGTQTPEAALLPLLGGHARQTSASAPVTLLALPAGHKAQVEFVVAPIAELHVPARQRLHAEMDVAPIEALHVPPKHGVHTLAPALLHLPAGHGEHTSVDAPGVLLHLPALHMVHVANETAPDIVLNVPGMH